MGFIAAATIKRYEPYFSPRFKTPCHVVQIVLIHAVLGLATARLFLKDAPKGRSNSIGLGMGAKSLMIIFYQLGTEHVNCLKRWASLKAFAILNVLEIVFWGAVAFLTLKANINQCVGKGCAMGWAIVALAVILGIFAKYVAVISVLDWYNFRNSKKPSPEEIGLKSARQRGEEESLRGSSNV